MGIVDFSKNRYIKYCLLPLIVTIICGCIVGTNAADRFAAIDGTPIKPAFLSESITAAPGIEGGKVNINTASAETLMLLDGIGEVLAQRIIEKRDALSGFTKIEDIMSVTGIGEGMFEKLRDYITVD